MSIEDKGSSQSSGVSSREGVVPSREGAIMQELPPEQLLVNQHMQRLDEVSRHMEACWGIDRLPKCVSPELREKWDKQWLKFSTAMLGCQWAEVIDLAQGCVRAWEALDKAARASGFSPDVATAMEARMPSGSVLRVCASAIDARRPTPEGYIVYSMEQVARILDGHQLVNVIKNTPPAVEDTFKPKPFPAKGGDSIPF